MVLEDMLMMKLISYYENKYGLYSSDVHDTTQNINDVTTLKTAVDIREDNRVRDAPTVGNQNYVGITYIFYIIITLVDKIGILRT